MCVDECLGYGTMKYIALVEDNPLSLRVLETLLKRLLPQDVWKIVSVSLAKDAIHLIEQMKFEYIFLDLHLPDGSGEDIARACKTTILNSNAILIAMTAYEGIRHDKLFSFSMEKPITKLQLQDIFDKN